ncbi:hypothetical protein ABZ135_31565 [Streptomyces sp. NPDC006339]|uniref:hypothetical protein n=1 Tax=Streptomyces sp. NPDC006339 TaxID=3156755 RepID=UPI0033BD50A1
MTLLILSGVLALVVAGCVCVVWSTRGGPRWTRAVAKATLAASDATRAAQRTSRKGGNGNNETPGPSDGN